MLPEEERPYAWSCTDFLQRLVERYDGRAVYDVRYQNDCPETVQLRLSAILYTLPDRLVRDYSREETTIRSDDSDWVCGDGRPFTACLFADYRVGNEAFGVSWSTNFCYLDETCRWPEFPEP